MKNIKPKILMIAPLPPPVHGSAMMTQYIKNSKLINENYKLDWVNLSTSRSMTEIGKISIKKVVRFIGSYITTVIKLTTNRYKFCYLAITCHGLGFIKDAPFALLCKLFGHKIIIHQHNKGMSKDVCKPFYYSMLNAVYKHSKVILLSEKLYPDISEIVDTTQVVICPNGIPKVPKYAQQSNPMPKLLFLSNLIESKGVLILLDACKILKDRGYKFTCDFIGGETKEIDSSRFEKEVMLRGLSDYIFYSGPKYGEEKYQEISKCDIFVFPTTYENECFPLALLEAMQQAKPIVTSTEGGIPDIVKNGENGFSVYIDNPNTVADAIEKFFSNPDSMLKMGMKGYEDYSNKFTLESFEMNILNIFKSI